MHIDHVNDNSQNVQRIGSSFLKQVKSAHAMIGTTKLVIKYFLEKMVSFANQKVSIKVILGLSHHFIQMGLSGLNAKQNQND